MNDRNRKNKNSISPTAIVGLLVILFVLPGELAAILIFLGVIGFVGYLIFKAAKSGKATRSSTQNSFDDCPKPLRFHRDKGEHYVRKGKEIDPWDRPDIDIRKYQHRN